MASAVTVKAKVIWSQGTKNSEIQIDKEDTLSQIMGKIKKVTVDTAFPRGIPVEAQHLEVQYGKQHLAWYYLRTDQNHLYGVVYASGLSVAAINASKIDNTEGAYKYVKGHCFANAALMTLCPYNGSPYAILCKALAKQAAKTGIGTVLSEKELKVEMET